MHDRIFEIAAQTLSPAEDERPLLDTLCHTAEAELTMRLRDGIFPEDCGNVYVLAAAQIAAAEMMLLRSVKSVEQFTAGEVSIRQSAEKTGVAAALLRRQASNLIAPFCSDDGFAFVGVDG